MKRIALGEIAMCICVCVGQTQTLPDSMRTSDPNADYPESIEDVPSWHEMLTRVPGDWGRFADDSFRVERIPAIVGVAGLTAALVLADNETWRATDQFSNQSPRLRELTHFLAEPGDGKVVLGLAGSFAIFGWTADDSRALRTASQLVESYLACGITVQVLKHITGRERPERQSQPRGRWRLFPNQREYHRSVPKFDAFPSGHTAAAMAMVTVLVENYPEAKWLKPLGYAVVGLVGFGLVARGWHWYSDFPLAIALGYQFGKIAAHPLRDRPAPSDDTDAKAVSFAPSMNSNGVGFMVSFSF